VQLGSPRLARFFTGFVAVLVLAPALVFAIRTVAPDRGADDPAPMTAAPAAPAPLEQPRQTAPPAHSGRDGKAKHRHRADEPRAGRIVTTQQESTAADAADGDSGELLVSTPTREPEPQPQPQPRAGTLEDVMEPVKDVVGPLTDDIPETVGRVIPRDVDLVDAPVLPEVEAPATLTPVVEVPETPDVPAVVPETPDVLPDTGTDPTAIPEEDEAPADAVLIDPRSELGRALMDALGIERSDVHGAWLRLDLATLAEQPRD